MKVFGAKRLWALGHENAKLKRMLADAVLDNAALRISWERGGDGRCRAESCFAPVTLPKSVEAQKSAKTIAVRDLPFC
jgi:hypothetical protein